MLDAIGYASLDDLLGRRGPGEHPRAAARSSSAAGRAEAEVAAELRALAARNQVLTSMIGLGYYGTITPAGHPAQRAGEPGLVHRVHAVPARDQPGPARGAAQLPDDGRGPHRAAGRRRVDARRGHRGRRGDGAGAPASRKAGDTFVVDADALPQTLDVVRTRAEPLGLEVRRARPAPSRCRTASVFGVLVQYPGASGAVRDLAPLVEAAHERGALVVVAADLLALTLLTPPGEVGADIAVGTTQRFGVPLGFGGPHAGYLAVRTGLERQLPGRLVGVSVDADGAARPTGWRCRPASSTSAARRRRSNICTAQVLLAVIAACTPSTTARTGCGPSPGGCTGSPRSWRRGCASGGVDVAGRPFFDTVTARVPGRAAAVVAAARERGHQPAPGRRRHRRRRCDEVTTPARTSMAVWSAFGVDAGRRRTSSAWTHGEHPAPAPRPRRS